MSVENILGNRSTNRNRVSFLKKRNAFLYDLAKSGYPSVDY